MLRTDRRAFLTLTGGAAAALSLPLATQAQAQALDGADIDAIVESFMAAFSTPGVAVAVIRPGQPDYVKGYGVRTLGKPEKVDTHTQFGVASNTKAFTAAAMALLVEDGKVEWDAPVIRYIPEFKMQDPALTPLVSVRDLLSHRAGLGLGQGDLMLFPASDHTREDQLKGVAHLKPKYPFRSGYAYNNVMFTIAGLVIERVSGLSYEAFVTQRLLKPLGMIDSVVGWPNVTGANVAGRHARLTGPLRGIGDYKVVLPEETLSFSPAAGLVTSVTGILPWLHVQLKKGVLPDGQRLFSEASSREMWKPNTIVGSGAGPTTEAPAAALFRTYGLGWFIQDYRGLRLVSHSGGLVGQVTQQALLPEKGIAVAVYTNVEDGVSSQIRNALLDRLIGAPSYDWLNAAKVSTAKAAEKALADAPQLKPGIPSLPLDAYAGSYRDPWYGDVKVTVTGKGKTARLSIDFTRTARLKGPMEVFGPDVFRTRFPVGWGEDAVVTFEVAGGKVLGMAMKAFSPLADFSF
ncbi:MAG: serine hydrolase, partial [Asticcacaulis sp.]